MCTCTVKTQTFLLQQCTQMISSNEETNKVIYEFVLKWDLTEVNDHNLLLGLTVKCFENRDISLSQSMYFECILKYFNL